MNAIIKTGLILIVVSLLAGISFAQEETEAKHTRAFGFSMLLELPKPTLGFAGYSLKPKAFGWYGDIRVGLPIHGGENVDYYGSIEQGTFNDPKIDEAWDRIIVNVGITRKVNNDFFLYSGVGLSYNELFYQLDDPLDILGDSEGHYWIKANETKWVPNFVIGGMLYGKPDSQAGLSVGFHSANLGVEVGFTFSLWTR